ncbi:hypothetical protein OSB04_000163 [Centaurea solstitialis]|uniref:Uncharacterized protein n=1 Tax=Centaurea solstitialis TaxID=347529 RepID=A0AA38WK98_9ASTR|nr:hypothetical protein OSB04_000163 [Centaurea solstitialis]
MVGIDPDIISHKLNVDPSFKPVKQKRRKFAAERNKVINDEDLEAMERKSTKKARKREKCTKSTQETLGNREILNLAPPDSTDLKIRVDLSIWRRQTSSLAIAR